VEKRNFKLIALDVDGTLLNEEGEISEANRQAIQQARELGVDVVLSTGRSILTCRDYALSLSLTSYLVTVNGSEIWDGEGNLLERHILDSSHVEMMQDLAQLHQTRFWATATDRVWRQNFPEDISSHKWLKFGFDIDDDGTRKTILARLTKTGQLEISNSSPTNIEINALGVNKANGLRSVCQRMGIGMHEVIAMGDSLNDIEMIKQVGCGVAMGNAQEEVKNAADWVTATNEEDGVAKAIVHWVLR
jgi:5-amino-6-(5-phospho-D-ribitylamino)uracil phosphatase